MADYRIYQLDTDGDIVAGFDARCPSDEAACLEAARVADGHPRVEVWSGTRRVATLAAASRRLH